MARVIEIYDVYDSSAPETFGKCNVLNVWQAENGEWSSQMYNHDGLLMTYSTSCFKTRRKLLDAFARHRPTCFLALRKRIEI